MAIYRNYSMLSRVPGVFLAVAGATFAAYVAHITLGVGGPGADAFFNEDIYNVVMVASALALITRAASAGADRAALLLIGLGLLTWALGDLYYTLFFTGLKNPPFPSFDDALYLAYYPFLFVGLGLLGTLGIIDIVVAALYASRAPMQPPAQDGAPLPVRVEPVAIGVYVLLVLFYTTVLVRGMPV